MTTRRLIDMPRPRHGPGRARVIATLLALAAWMAPAQATRAAIQDPPGEAVVAPLLAGLERAIRSGDPAALDPWLDASLDPARADALRFDLAHAGTTDVVLRERDLGLLTSAPPDTYRIVAEMFLRVGDAARIRTYRLDARRTAGPTGDTWRVVDAERMSSVDGLHRLRLDESAQMAVRNLRVRAEDFELAVPAGTAFAARTPEGLTALVVLGDGTMTFSPRPPAERVQVRLFSGQETLVAAFTQVFLRMNPDNVADFLDTGALAPEPRVDGRALERAQALFTQQVGRSFTLDLTDLNRDTWSLLPSVGDLIADVRTRRHGLLTYARANNEAEDITLFDRQTRRNIALYPSRRKLEVRGRSYSEDELADYDVTDYDVQATYQPDREWLQGTTRLRLRVRAYSLSALTVRLAEALAVQSVHSERHGRLLALRVRGQNAVIVSLPAPVPRDEYVTLTVRYAGRLESLAPDREVAQVSANPLVGPDTPVLLPEPRWVFSNRSYWHPQNTVTDFARGTMRLTVPDTFQVMASGDPVGAPAAAAGGRRTWEFAVRQPVRYLSWVVSRFTEVGRTEVVLPAPAATDQPANGGADPGRSQAGTGVFYRGMDVAVTANPRQISRGRALLPQVAAVLTFYGTLLDDFPYPSFTLALVDHELPGGHSPAYFALLHQPLPTTPYMWRNDPVHFDEFPQFFLAHELAHQFWGQSVGWKSYHEQWISEGFAQYFALLYAERHSGPGVVRSVLARMRSTALSSGGQGPVTLGYRLGHVKGDSRVFRAVVYNKSALVLHMLRGLLGDEVFFDGLRRFYRASRFSKVGTDEVRAAFEAASGRSLEGFFERWIHEFAVPTFRYSGQADGATLRVTFAQQAGTDFELPVTVTVRYADGSVDRHVVPLAAGTSVHEVPLRGTLRDWQVNEDRAALAHFES